MLTHPCRDVVEQGAGLGEVGASWVRADDSLQRVPGGVAVVPATLLVRLVTGDLVAGREPAQVDAFRPRCAQQGCVEGSRMVRRDPCVGPFHGQCEGGQPRW